MKLFALCTRKASADARCLLISVAFSSAESATPHECDVQARQVRAEKPLACKQDDGELAPKCPVALPQNMCSLPR